MLIAKLFLGLHEMPNCQEPEGPMSEVVTAEQYAISRQINAQLNYTESRNNLPVVNSRPLRLGLDISDVCNIRCIFCLAEDGRKKSSNSDAFRKPEWLDPFEPLFPFIETAILSSYEAILNPWFDQFVERLWRYQTPIELFTNGNALDANIAEYLLDHKLQSLWCSFHGARQKTYHSIMKGSDYDKVLKNLMHMKIYSRKRGLKDYKLTMVFCAMRRNIEELTEYVDLAHRVGAQSIQVNYLLVTKPDTGLDREAMCFHPDLYDGMVLAAKAKAAKMGITLNHQRLFRDGRKEADSGPCYRPWEHLNVSQGGQAAICCGGCGNLGNMFAQGFPQLWNSARLTEFRARVNSDNPPAACRACTRGREDPHSLFTHLTYLRYLPEEKREARIRELAPEAERDASQAMACAM
jgi:MoaA/NifB/PqqE/SkfB family radical SAM enzyme